MSVTASQSPSGRTALFGLAFFTCFSCAVAIGADEILEMPGLIEAPVEAPETPDTGAKAPAPVPESAPPGPRRSELDRPWMPTTPLVETGYGLDRGTAWGGIWRPAVSTPLQMKIATAALRVGVTDSITVGAGWSGALLKSSSMLLIGDVKWNFLNAGPWSFAVQPWAGYQAKKQTITPDAPFGANLAGSLVLDPYQKLHLSFSYGKNHELEGYGWDDSYYGSDGSYHYSSYGSNYDTRYEVFRFSVGYELRMNRRHGVTFSVSPQYLKKFSSYASTSNYGSVSYSSSTTDEYKVGILPGVAYHYQKREFGFGIGLEAGPTYENYKYVSNGQSTSNYTNNSLEVLGMANIAGSVDVRF